MLVGLLLLLLLFFFFFFLPFTSCWVALSYRCKHARYLCCALPLVLAAAEEETDAIEDVLASLATAVHMEQLEADGGASSDDDDDDDGQGAGKNSAADMNSDVLDLFPTFYCTALVSKACLYSYLNQHRARLTQDEHFSKQFCQAETQRLL